MVDNDSASMSPEEIARQQQQNCIFCHIISGKVQSKKVYEDEETIGILDINPANPGHVLLLPKKHYAIMPQMNDFEIGHLFMVTKSLSGALLKALKADGTNIFVANGAIAGQKAPHFMAHVIPRKEGDKLALNIPEHKISIAELLNIRDMLLPKIKIHLGLSDADAESMVAETATLNQTMPKSPAITALPEKNNQDMQKNEVPITTSNKKIDLKTAGFPKPKIPLHENQNNMQDENIDLDAISGIINPKKNIAPKITRTKEIAPAQEQKETEQASDKKDKQRKITLSEIEGLFKYKDR
jgi:histidine triad (HIT) family protein